MADKKQAFNDVKAILNKLDRSIDEARQKRLNGPEGEDEGNGPDSEPIGSDERPPEPTKPAPRAGNDASGPEPAVPLAAPQRRAGASPYGRAKAIRADQNGSAKPPQNRNENRNQNGTQNGPTNHWRSA